MDRETAIQALHDRCAVFTAEPTAKRLLDLIGWPPERDLESAVLLEPCVGEGAILLEGAKRLIRSVRDRRLPLSLACLAPRIRGFELHAPTATVARLALERLLSDEGLPRASAKRLASDWIRVEDFLLADPAAATHVAANPPYLRWGKLPPPLSDQYRAKLRPLATRGDISVAFLERMLQWAGGDGKISALVSDRWIFAQYGAEFLAECALQGWHLDVIEERADQPFVRKVGAYPTIVRLTRGQTPAGVVTFVERSEARRLHARLVERYGTLSGAGCRVRVGPALGCGVLYLLPPEETKSIERTLLRSYVDRSGLVGQRASISDRVVISPYDASGRLISLESYPKFKAWALRNKKRLKARSQFKEAKVWWRTIDAIGLQWQQGPKLLVPELCREPRAVLDDSVAIPAHSIYAIWTDEWPIKALQRVLNGGLLSLTARAEAPRVGNGWFRFYKRFLERTPVPRWQSLGPSARSSLSRGDWKSFSGTFEELFGFAPKSGRSE